MLPADTFRGRVAVVTGGGSGIGAAIAAELARLGAAVALLGRRPEPLAQASDEIVAAGGTARGYPVDVRERGTVERVMRSVIGDFGRIDHLVNNAAGNFRTAPEAMSENAWNAVVRIVLDGTWNCTQTVGRHMIERGGGSILNIGSIMASRGGPDTVHSASAKAGVVAMTKSLAVAWGPHGIRVNILIPGITQGTAGVKALYPDAQAHDGVGSQIPLRRLGTRAELAEAASYLLSDHASYVTGAELVVDGGRGLGVL